MPIRLPEECPRGCNDCSPLYQIRSDPEFDDDPETFICLGLNDGSTRVVDGDIFRKCVRGCGPDVDRMEDCDRHDLVDEALVILQGLSIAENLTTVLDKEGEDDDSQERS